MSASFGRSVVIAARCCPVLRKDVCSAVGSVVAVTSKGSSTPLSSLFASSAPLGRTRYTERKLPTYRFVSSHGRCVNHMRNASTQVSSAAFSWGSCVPAVLFSFLGFLRPLRFTSSTRTRRGGSCLKDKYIYYIIYIYILYIYYIYYIYIRPFSSIELACAPCASQARACVHSAKVLSCFRCHI